MAFFSEKKEIGPEPYRRHEAFCGFEEFFKGALENELRFFVADLLAPVVTRDPFVFGRKIYDPAVFDKVGSRAVYLPDLVVRMHYEGEIRLFKSLIGSDAYYADAYFTGSGVKPAGQKVIDGRGKRGFIEQLRSAFKVLWTIYDAVDFGFLHARKVVFHKHGYNEAMRLTGSIAEIDRAGERVKEQLRKLMAGEVAVVDALDSFSTVGIDVSRYMDAYEFFFKELSRILKIPQTKLFGRAAGGLNATGESDLIMYEETLQSFRKSHIYPLLDAFEIEYQVKNHTDLAYVERVCAIAANLNAPLPPALKSQLMEDLLRPVAHI